MIEIFASANYPRFDVVYWDKYVKKNIPVMEYAVPSQKEQYC